MKTFTSLALCMCLASVYPLCGCDSEKQPERNAGDNAIPGELNATGEQALSNIRYFEGEARSYHCIAVSPDSKFVAAGAGTNELPNSPGSGSGQIYLWDVETGKVKGILRGHKEIVTSIAFSPDGNFLLSAAQDSTVRLWDLKTGIELRSIGKHTPPMGDLSFMPDGERVLVTSGTPSPISDSVPADPIQVSLYDLETGELLKEFGSHTLSVTDIAMSKDGRILATAAGWAHIWDIETGTQKSMHKKPGVIESVALSPNGNLLLTGNFNGIVTLRNMETGTCEHMPMHTRNETGEHFEQVSAVAFSTDGTLGASGGWSKRACIWQLQGDTVHYWDFEHWVTDIAFSPSSYRVYASCWAGYIVEITPPLEMMVSASQ